jgi:hypothetical protein
MQRNLEKLTKAFFFKVQEVAAARIRGGGVMTRRTKETMQD